MKTLLSVVLVAIVAMCVYATAPKKQRAKSPAVLVFSKTKGFRHESIPSGIAAIKKLGVENNFTVTATEDSSMFTPDTLKNYQAVIFLSTTGDVLNTGQEAAFMAYMRKGGAFVGVHAAADCEYNWEWYGKLVGAYFKSHPRQQMAKVRVVEGKHPSTKGLPLEWERYDEWYNYKNINPEVKVLMKLDETSYKGGENGDNHPIAWCHNYDGGRAFYTGLGHTNESFTEPKFLAHLLGGIEYALGRKK
ncbi:ThuA domain-containing protein [Segetibacter sp. 3557_3]|uniref:ThuA domain-containing protein n=1 Tax=Segetibacter sp. 3557_3 TaxID=2547429 RepID=UPI0010588CFA|nr:ThuA domain-containing protein [Segetibacter sp. 3557_3]TDH25630.1 ThuA domain-containing protein [Segetibacter sp. 3557_3]